jgi:hypothetical protein
MVLFFPLMKRTHLLDEYVASESDDEDDEGDADDHETRTGHKTGTKRAATQVVYANKTRAH